MKLSLLLLLLVLVLPLASALDAQIGIDLSSNGLARENFVISGLDPGLASFKFTSLAEPLSVIYAGNFSVLHDNNSYVLAMDPAGQKQIRFSILYDGLVEKTARGRVFRSSFQGEEFDSIELSVSLPEGNFMRDDLGALPKPSSVGTDGQRIGMSWQFKGGEDADIVVFYSGTGSPWLAWLLIFLAVALVAGSALAAIAFSRHKVRRVVTETLSEDENLVVGLVRQNVVKQKDIAAGLGFSKSKMSKVMRKLEEKGLVEKTAFFKTYKIKLKKI